MADGFVHVVQEGSQWCVRVEGATRARSKHRTQADAVTAGRAAARKAKTELLVHGRDGAIRTRRSYGNDPADRPG